MTTGYLLWCDDEIELLRAHIIFLQKKGYEVVTVSNGTDAIEQCRQHTFDLVLLDEMMPGLTGLETLQQIKEIQPATPVVMVTKSEEENIMDQAIGSKIADYLIKPVNPSQILLTLKKNIHKKQIVTEVTQTGYQQNFQNIAMQIMDSQSTDDWKDVYRRLVHWELELSSTRLPAQQRVAVAGGNNFIQRVLPENIIKDLQNPVKAQHLIRPPCRKSVLTVSFPRPVLSIRSSIPPSTFDLRPLMFHLRQRLS